MDPFTLSLILQGAGAGFGALQGATQKSGKWSQQYTKDPQQRAAQSQALQMGLSQLQNPYEGFEPIANQARTQFETQTIPSIAERFTNMGSGAQRSSAFQGALGSAGAGLEQSLAALKSQYGFQNRDQGRQLLGQGLESNFDNVYTAGGPSLWSSLFGGLAGGVSSLGQAAMQKDINQPIVEAIKGRKPNNVNQTLSFIQQRAAQQRANPIDSMQAMAPEALGTAIGVGPRGAKFGQTFGSRFGESSMLGY